MAAAVRREDEKKTGKNEDFEGTGHRREFSRF
jgi:hypothetical protein